MTHETVIKFEIIKSLVDYMSKQLDFEKRGKSIIDFLGTFPYRGVCNDSDLDALTKQASDLLYNVNTKLDKSVKDKPVRLISLEGEE